ncbi:helveticin J family class III bacteriocin [Levilactobacillus lindianensis]|uniref:helveticin J family class III bacteriocin n=1 Tax=Levilactobacillus lindianensis TaxID=2486018 RepID=UPI000F7420E8|nr:helveticin J family class III bacteriocin [Levilactobacillus lindianensis]
MSVTPHLLSDFGTSSLTPENALQSFVIDKDDPGVGYGVFQHNSGKETWIVKYNYDVSNADAKQNHITPVSNFKIGIGAESGLGAGHSGSIQVYHRNGQTYLIVATKMTATGGTHKYATQLTRIPVSDFGNNNRAVPYDELKRIGSLQNVGGSSLGTPDRVEFAIDYCEEKIAVWVFDPKTKSRMALYNLDDLDALFNKANPEITIKGTSYGLVSNFLGYTKAEMFDLYDVTKEKWDHRSLQGLALTSAGSVYVACENGVGDPKKTSGAKGIWKFKVGAGDSGKPTRLDNNVWSEYTAGVVKDANSANKTKVGVEMENLQIIGGELYLAVTYHDANNGVAHLDKNRLYHFDKTLI